MLHVVILICCAVPFFYTTVHYGYHRGAGILGDLDFGVAGADPQDIKIWTRRRKTIAYYTE